MSPGRGSDRLGRCDRTVATNPTAPLRMCAVACLSTLVIPAARAQEGPLGGHVDSNIDFAHDWPTPPPGFALEGYSEAEDSGKAGRWACDSEDLNVDCPVWQTLGLCADDSPHIIFMQVRNCAPIPTETGRLITFSPNASAA